MQDKAKRIANNASFQAFVNCYLKEIDPGVWHDAQEWQSNSGVNLDKNQAFVLEVQLQALETTLAIGVSYQSLVGRHTLCNVYQKHQSEFNWQETNSVSAIMLLIESIFSGDNRNLSLKGRQLELTSRVIQSHQVMEQYIRNRINDHALENPEFIDSEQSLLFGHWLHPTPKSRQGIHD